jgi:tRNA threonylcarbamoyladenosine biosynthesis protein TsaB
MSPILGFDTATPDTTVAITAPGGEALAELRIDAEEGARPRHARDLLPAVDQLVRRVGGWEEIELIAVGIGPGSFTGLRIGVATARALGQARALPLAAVTTTGALAVGIEAEAGADRIAVVDARRGEVFAAILRAGVEAAEAPVVVAPEEVAAALQPGGSARAAGDGAVRFGAELRSGGIEVLPAEDRSHRLSALHICRLGEAAETLAPAGLKPLYLRRPDAERWLERDHGN